MKKRQFIHKDHIEKFIQLSYSASQKEGLCIFELDDIWRILTWWNHKETTKTLETIPQTTTPYNQTVPFDGGWVGWLQYPKKNSERSSFFWKTDGAICLHIPSQSYHIVGTEGFCEEANRLFAQKPRSYPSRVPSRIPLPNKVVQNGFIHGVQTLKKAIKEGEVYQANLSWKSDSFLLKTPLQNYFHIQKHNPARFGCFLQFQEHQIISNSPERFLYSWNTPQGRMIVSQPIKGTAAHTLQGRKNLWNNQKEKAELTMITDLIRNDIGRVAKIGSVHTQHRQLRRCGDLLHAEQSVFGILKPKHSFKEVIDSLFPAGSITGAPKIAAMKFIAQLESHERGLYTGALGFFANNTNIQFNVAIRTLHVYKEQSNLFVGCGIVIDSQAQKEWEESLAKGRALSNLLFT